MFLRLRQAFLERDRKKLAELRTMDDQVDVLEGDILRYLAALRIQELSEDESTELALSMKAADLFESVGDVIETELVDLGYRALEEGIETSETMRHLLKNLADKLSNPGVDHKSSTRARSAGRTGGVNVEGGH